MVPLVVERVNNVLQDGTYVPWTVVCPIFGSAGSQDSDSDQDVEFDNGMARHVPIVPDLVFYCPSSLQAEDGMRWKGPPSVEVLHISNACWMLDTYGSVPHRPLAARCSAHTGTLTSGSQRGPGNNRLAGRP